jgi:hypothetical protein
LPEDISPSLHCSTTSPAIVSDGPQGTITASSCESCPCDPEPATPKTGGEAGEDGEEVTSPKSPGTPAKAGRSWLKCIEHLRSDALDCSLAQFNELVNLLEKWGGVGGFLGLVHRAGAPHFFSNMEHLVPEDVTAKDIAPFFQHAARLEGIPGLLNIVGREKEHWVQLELYCKLGSMMKVSKPEVAATWKDLVPLIQKNSPSVALKILKKMTEDGQLSKYEKAIDNLNGKGLVMAMDRLVEAQDLVVFGKTFKEVDLSLCAKWVSFLKLCHLDKLGDRPPKVYDTDLHRRSETVRVIDEA